MGWCYSLLVSRVWFWGRCYAAAAGRHRATTRTTLCVPHLPLTEREVYLSTLSPHSLLACTCRNVASTTRTCPPPWLRTRIPETSSSESNLAAQRPHFFFFSSLISRRALFQGLKLHTHPLLSAPPTAKLSSREVRCLFMSFDFFICGVSNGQRTAEAGATNEPGWVSF